MVYPRFMVRLKLWIFILRCFTAC